MEIGKFEDTVIVYRATFNNISVRWWRSVLLVEEIGATKSLSRGRDHMIIGFTNSYAIRLYHH
jgi:hypothetical protein